MSAELVDLQESARSVLDGAGVASDEAAMWTSLAGLGWLMVGVPEEQGGLGQGLAGAAAIYTEMGRALSKAPYASAMLAIEALHQSAHAERGAWLERLMAGEYVAAALAESACTIAGGKISGALVGVPSADSATHILVITGTAIALVKQSDAKLSPRTTWDKTRRLFDVRFENAPASLILAEGAEAAALAERLRAHRDFALAADAVGGAAAVLDMSVEYLKTRRQYGRPLAMFQALKHRCADLKVAAVAAEALVTSALSRVDIDTDTATLALLGKKVKQHACATYAMIAEEAIQLHGGIGMTSEHPCHLYLLRALLNTHLGRPASAYEADIAASVA